MKNKLKKINTDKATFCDGNSSTVNDYNDIYNWLYRYWFILPAC